MKLHALLRAPSWVLLGSGWLVSSGQVQAETLKENGRDKTAAVATEEAAVASERQALFEAERDAVMAGNLSPQAVGEKKAEFMAANLESIMAHRIRAQEVATTKAKKRGDNKASTEDASADSSPATAGTTSSSVFDQVERRTLSELAQAEAQAAQP